MARPRSLVSGLLALCLAAGCSGTAPAAPDPGATLVPAPSSIAGPTDPTGVRVEVLQGRTDIASGLMVIRVVNNSAAPVGLRSATYRDGRFVEAAHWSGDSTVPAENARDYRAPVPAASCTDRPADPSTELVLADGTVVHPPTADPHGFVARSTDDACLAAEVAAAVTLTLTGPRSEGSGADEVMVLTLRAEPRGDHPVRIVEVAGTPLLSPAGGGSGWPVDRAVTDVLEVPLAVAPNRCDPHAVADDKAGTRFRVSVTLGPDRSGQVVVVADDDQRSLLYDFVTRRCAAGPPG